MTTAMLFFLVLGLDFLTDSGYKNCNRGSDILGFACRGAKKRYAIRTNFLQSPAPTFCASELFFGKRGKFQPPAFGAFSMTNKKGCVERRQVKRFKVAEGAFAALVNQGSKLGQIRDISKTGLSFRYIDSQEAPADARELKILLGSGGLCVDKVPFKKVTDFEIKSEFSFSSIKMRQIGLQFGELNPTQRVHLDNFILNHTIGEA